MAAATVVDNQGTCGLDRNVNTRRYEVWWNGQLIATCDTLADAQAVAAQHPA